MHFPTDITSVQSPPDGSPDIAPRSSPGDGDGQTLAVRKTQWGCSNHPPRLSIHPSFFRPPEDLHSQPPGLMVCSAGGQLLTTFHGQGGEEHHISTNSRSPCAPLGAALGDTGLCWVGMQSPGETLRSVPKVPSPNRWQVASLAAMPELWTSSLGTCMQLCDAASRGQEGLGTVTSWCQRLLCMVVASQEDQASPFLPLQSLSHLQEPMGGCVVPVPNHGPAKRRTRVSPACTHPAPRWVPTHRVPGRASPRLTPGTRKPRNGVKNQNLNIQNLNLDFARSCKIRGCLEGVKGREDTVRHHPAGGGRRPPEEQPWLGDVPCRHTALPLWAQWGQKMAF